MPPALLERIRRRRPVRLWALVVPALVLAVALPMLRPLRHPDAAAVSDDERVRLATIESIALRGSLAPEPSDVAGCGNLLEIVQPDGAVVRLAAQEPMLAVLGAGVYQLLRLAGIRPAVDEVLGTYVLTAVLSTLPVALTALLLYRLGRLLELGRGRRALLAWLSVIGGGLLPFGVVLSPQPMAAFLATSAMACIAHAALTVPAGRRNARRDEPSAGVGFAFALSGAGFLGGLACAVLPPSAALAGALALSVLAMPWRRQLRLVGFVLFLLGAFAPLAAHKLLLTPYGDIWTVPAPPPSTSVLATINHETPDGTRPPPGLAQPAPPPAASEEPSVGISSRDTGRFDSTTAPPDALLLTFWALRRLVWVLLGAFGVLSHAPVVLIGVSGVAVLLVKYWPGATRSLAVASVVGVLLPLMWWAWGPPRGGERFWGPQPVAAMLPLLVLWAGVYLRPGRLQRLGLTPRLAFAGAVAVSVASGLLGAVHPAPRGGYAGYGPYIMVSSYVRQRLLPAAARPPPARPPGISDHRSP